MTEPHVIPELDEKGLREFGLVTGGIFAGLFGLFFPWLLESSIPVWPWVLCAILALLALVRPILLKGTYHWWMRFALLLSKITTPIILGIVYFIVVTPMALVMRLLGKDPMHREWSESITSYRVPSDKSDKSRLENPF